MLRTEIKLIDKTTSIDKELHRTKLHYISRRILRLADKISVL